MLINQCIPIPPATCCTTYSTTNHTNNHTNYCTSYCIPAGQRKLTILSIILVQVSLINIIKQQSKKTSQEQRIEKLEHSNFQTQMSGTKIDWSNKQNSERYMNDIMPMWVYLCHCTYEKHQLLLIWFNSVLLADCYFVHDVTGFLPLHLFLTPTVRFEFCLLFSVLNS